MKAIVLHEYGPTSNLAYEDIADPRPAEGEVLVRVVATSINPADWLVRAGAVKDIIPVTFPYIPGCDFAGTVVEVGEGVTGFEPGDRVMAVARCTYAELCTIKASDLVKIPAGLEMIAAAALPLVNLTGDQMIRRGARVSPVRPSSSPELQVLLVARLSSRRQRSVRGSLLAFVANILTLPGNSPA